MRSWVGVEYGIALGKQRSGWYIAGSTMLQLAWSCPAPDLSVTRDGGDPLGLRAYANRLARELCPGLTQTTRRTRGFSLLTLGLQFALQSEDEDSANDCFLRFERLFVVAQVHHFGGVRGAPPRGPASAERDADRHG